VATFRLTQNKTAAQHGIVGCFHGNGAVGHGSN
jgi:hypothetical protein